MKILLAEDENQLRAIYSKVFQKEGIEVIAVSDGLEAYKALKKHSDIDIIVSDLKMPYYDGFWLLDKVKGDSDLKHLPFVVISGYIDGSESILRIKGVSEIISKPCDIRKLVDLVHLPAQLAS